VSARTHATSLALSASGPRLRDTPLSARPGGEGEPLPRGCEEPWTVVLARAQRAPGLLIFVDRMPAHAGARSGWEGLIVRGVHRTGHGRSLYAEGLTFHPRQTDREIPVDRYPRPRNSSSPAATPGPARPPLARRQLAHGCRALRRHRRTDRLDHRGHLVSRSRRDYLRWKCARRSRVGRTGIARRASGKPFRGCGTPPPERNGCSGTAERRSGELRRKSRRRWLPPCTARAGQRGTVANPCIRTSRVRASCDGGHASRYCCRMVYFT
jgi:hypothetical protein